MLGAITGIWAAKRAITDPHFGLVRVLAHMDGLNGATTYVDSSSSPKVITNAGASLSTAQSMFGGSSLRSTGGNSRADVAHTGLRFLTSSGGFCIEFFIRMDSVNAGLYPIASTYPGGGNPLLWFVTEVTGTLGCYMFGSVIGGANTGAPVTANTWCHMAATWDGTTRRLFKDGVLYRSDTTTVLSQNLDTGWSIGGPSSSIAGNGGSNYVDEFRVTYGAARYTSNFTPPTLAFPNA